MLGAKLAYNPKIKVVTLLEFYNFALGYTAMQTFYDIVQPRSNSRWFANCNASKYNT